jgi:hypothetical protein
MMRCKLGRSWGGGLIFLRSNAWLPSNIWEARCVCQAFSQPSDIQYSMLTMIMMWSCAWVPDLQLVVEKRHQKECLKTRNERVCSKVLGHESNLCGGVYFIERKPAISTSLSLHNLRSVNVHSLLVSTQRLRKMLYYKQM